MYINTCKCLPLHGITMSDKHSLSLMNSSQYFIIDGLLVVRVVT
jgi:hypothetical protein